MAAVALCELSTARGTCRVVDRARCMMGPRVEGVVAGQKVPAWEVETDGGDANSSKCRSIRRRTARRAVASLGTWSGPHLHFWFVPSWLLGDPGWRVAASWTRCRVCERTLAFVCCCCRWVLTGGERPCRWSPNAHAACTVRLGARQSLLLIWMNSRTNLATARITRKPLEAVAEAGVQSRRRPTPWEDR